MSEWKPWRRTISNPTSISSKQYFHQSNFYLRDIICISTTHTKQEFFAGIHLRNYAWKLNPHTTISKSLGNEATQGIGKSNNNILFFNIQTDRTQHTKLSGMLILVLVFGGVRSLSLYLGVRSLLTSLRIITSRPTLWTDDHRLLQESNFTAR